MTGDLRSQHSWDPFHFIESYFAMICLPNIPRVDFFFSNGVDHFLRYCSFSTKLAFECDTFEIKGGPFIVCQRYIHTVTFEVQVVETLWIV